MLQAAFIQELDHFYYYHFTSLHFKQPLKNPPTHLLTKRSPTIMAGITDAFGNFLQSIINIFTSIFQAIAAAFESLFSIGSTIVGETAVLSKDVINLIFGTLPLHSAIQSRPAPSGRTNSSLRGRSGLLLHRWKHHALSFGPWALHGGRLGAGRELEAR